MSVTHYCTQHIEIPLQYQSCTQGVELACVAGCQRQAGAARHDQQQKTRTPAHPHTRRICPHDPGRFLKRTPVRWICKIGRRTSGLAQLTCKRDDTRTAESLCQRPGSIVKGVDLAAREHSQRSPGRATEVVAWRLRVRQVEDTHS